MWLCHFNIASVFVNRIPSSVSGNRLKSIMFYYDGMKDVVFTLTHYNISSDVSAMTKTRPLLPDEEVLCCFGGPCERLPEMALRKAALPFQQNLLCSDSFKCLTIRHLVTANKLYHNCYYNMRIIPPQTHENLRVTQSRDLPSSIGIIEQEFPLRVIEPQRLTNERCPEGKYLR